MVAHSSSVGTGWTEAGRSLRVPSQPNLQNETLIKEKEKEEEDRRGKREEVRKRGVGLLALEK